MKERHGNFAMNRLDNGFTVRAACTVQLIDVGFEWKNTSIGYGKQCVPMVMS